MRPAPIGRASGWLAVVLLVASPIRAAETAAATREVVFKSLDTKLTNEGRPVDPRQDFCRYRVEQARGDWLWLVARCGRRGWVRADDVVPVDEAVRYFSTILAREPQSARARHLRGLVYWECDNYRHAERDFDAALLLDPMFTAAYVGRCRVRTARSNFAGALADADAALQLDPKSADAYEARAGVWRRQGLYAKAVQDLDQAIALDPSDAVLYVWRAVARDSENDRAGAIADASEAIRLNPTQTDAYVARAVDRRRNKDYGDALADLNEAIRLNPARWRMPTRQFASIRRSRRAMPSGAACWPGKVRSAVHWANG